MKENTLYEIFSIAIEKERDAQELYDQAAKLSGDNEKLRKRLENVAGKEEITISVEGSVAKDTWLRNEKDIDIFIHIPPTFTRKRGLKIAKKATNGFIQIERFAEHPYLESVIDNIRVNIVPCYTVKK